MAETPLREPDLDALPDPDPTPKLGLVGLLVTGAANAVWAVIGLVFWIPVLVRAALVSSVRIVHSALTRQPPRYLRSQIQSASRFYLRGFWTRKDLRRPRTSQRHRLEARRFLGELAWAAIFYLLLLRLLDEERFARIWTVLAELAGSALVWLRRTVLAWIGKLPATLPRLLESGYLEWSIFALLLVGAFLAGLVLGRRRRR